MLESFLCDIANSFDSKFFLEYYSSDFFLLNIKDTIRIERNFPFRRVGAVRIANEFEQDAWKLFHAFLQISNSSNPFGIPFENKERPTANYSITRDKPMITQHTNHRFSIAIESLLRG